MEDKILKKEEGIQEKVENQLTNSESIHTNKIPNEEMSLPEVKKEASNDTSEEKEVPDANNIESQNSSEKENNSNDKNEMNFEMPSIKENVEEANTNSLIQDTTLNSISSSESSETVNNVTPKQPSLAPADFSAIFNVESEENTKNKTVSNNQVELPASEKNTNEVEENQNPEETTNPPEKKINKDLFNSEERIIYEIKPEKEGNPIVVVLFFLLLFSTIVALPYISKKLDLEGNGVDVKTLGGDDEEEDIYYFNRSSVRAKIGDLEFTNFVKSKRGNEYKLTFNITNTAEKPYLFDKKYYVIMYDEENIVYRALIHSYDAIGSNAAEEVTLTISERGYNNANKFKLEEITTARYPEVNLVENEGENKVMTCTYLNDEVKYYFFENKLVKFKETYHDTLESNTNFLSDLRKYNGISNDYKKIENFNSTFIETSTYFTMINEFEYKSIPDVTLSSLKQYKFFRYNETKEVVSFELEAQGYKCS